METIVLLVAAVALMGLGCAATVLSAYVYPLGVRGQAHGRYAGLSAIESDVEQGSRRKEGEPRGSVSEQPARNLIVA